MSSDLPARTREPQVNADPAAVLADIAEMLHTILDDYGVDDLEISPDTTFHADLDLESIDLVTLAGMLEAHYGDAINLAHFVARLDLDDIIALRVGQLVDFVVESLNDAESVHIGSTGAGPDDSGTFAS